MKTVYFFLAFILIWCKLHAQVITTIAGTGISGFSGEGGIATNAQFSFPDGITADKWGNVYIADRINSVVQKIDTNGILSRFAGNGLYGYTGDGSAATNARLSMYTAGMVTDTIGNLFISCNGTVRKVNALGIISTVAGNNNYGYSGDGGPATAAEFKTTTGICFDNAGNLYIADDQAYVIRMVNSAGIISTFAGTGTLGFSGDGGPATAAQLKTPAGITFDDSGNLYIADRSNQRIRKVNTSGIITSVAGGNPMVMPCCYWGCPATSLNIGPIGVAVDHEGNIYVADISHSVVQKITSDSKTYAIAGNCTDGFSGDGGPASAAQIYRPTMICLDNRGNLLITDKGNNRYRKVWLDGTVHTPPAPAPLPVVPALLIAPNPVTQKNISCTVQSDTNENAALVITDVLGRVVTTASCTTNTAANISLPLPSGMYFISATTASGLKMNAKIIVQ